MHLDIKVSVWQRIHFPASVTEAEAIKILRHTPGQPPLGYFSQYLHNTTRLLPPEGNEPTMVLYSPDNSSRKIIYKNT